MGSPRDTTWLRRAALGLTTGIAVLALAACGGDDDTESTTQAAGTATAACTPAHDFETRTPGKLTVSVAPALPYVQIEDGKLIGLEGVVLEEFAKRECLEIEALSFPGSAGALPALESGRADVLTGGWYLTPEREASKTLGHTDPIYYDFTAFVSKDGIDTLQAAGGKVAVGSGQLWTEQIQKVLGKDGVKLFQSTSEVFQDVASGRSTAAVMGSGEAGHYLQQAPGSKLVVKPAKPDPAFPSSEAINAETLLHDKANTQLTAALDATIADLREDGTVQKALDSFGLTNPITFSGKR